MVRVTVVMFGQTLAPLTAMPSSVLMSTHSTSESCPYSVTRGCSLTSCRGRDHTMTVGGVRGVVTLLVKRHITQVVSREPVMRCSPVPALSSAIHVTISERGQ